MRISLRIIIPMRVMRPKMLVRPIMRFMMPRPTSVPGSIRPKATMQSVVMPNRLKLNSKKKKMMIIAMMMPL